MVLKSDAPHTPCRPGLLLFAEDWLFAPDADRPFPARGHDRHTLADQVEHTCFRVSQCHDTYKCIKEKIDPLVPSPSLFCPKWKVAGEVGDFLARSVWSCVAVIGAE